MSSKHKKQKGEFEIRILKDGRLVINAPDENLHTMAVELINSKQFYINNMEYAEDGTNKSAQQNCSINRSAGQTENE